MRTIGRGLGVWLAAALLGATGMTAGAAQAQPLPRAATPEAVGFSTERLRRLDDALAGAVERGEVKGMATLLMRHGRIVSVRTWGNRDESRAMTRDTIFRMASMTKPITGVAMMMLFEEGKFKLDDPVSKYIPEFAKLQVATGIDKDGNPILEPAKRPPTMLHLMTHTAGLGYGMFQDLPGDRLFAKKAPLQAGSMEEMIRRMSEVPLLYQPGEHFYYSAAIDVQGYLVEKLSGMKLSEFLAKRLFAPLRMTDTGFWVPADKIDRLAAMYRTGAENKLTLAPPGGGFGGGRGPSVPPALESGGGGLYSTLDDYARFAQMLANKGSLGGVRILAPSTVELMGSNKFPKPLPAGFAKTLQWMFSDAMGFGLNMQVAVDPHAVGRVEGAGTLSWDGATGVWWWMDPANDVVFLGMIQNGYRAGPRSYQDLARQLVYQALVDPAK